jgi:phosphonatase-like hydrolase
MIVFDLAGTTVRDPGGVRDCFQAALQAAGLTVAPAIIDSIMGLPKPVAIQRMIRTSARRDLDSHVEEIHDDFVNRMIRYYREDPEVSEIPGASELFSRLQAAQVIVTVNTGFSRDIAEVIFTRLGWLQSGVIDASICSDEVPRGRPFPDMIRALMSQFGISNPKQVAKIGDTPADLEEGANAGCGWIIGVSTGTHTREQLSRYPHTHLILSVAELPCLFISLCN